MTISDKLISVEQNVPKVFESGKDAEHKSFWYEVTLSGTRVNYRYAFAGYGWTDKNFKPPETIYPQDARYMFQNSSVTTIDETQIDFTNTTEMRDVFNNCESLTTLRLKISGNKTFNASMFTNCAALTNLVIIGTIQSANFNLQYSTALTKASITSVVNALSSTTSGLTVTISKTAVNNAFGGSTSQEWLDLIATKPKWTISLV